MQIKLDKKFEINFYNILEYIAKDKLSASKKFREDLITQIKNLSSYPYKYRKSFYFNNDDIRDMTFKGYTVIFNFTFIIADAKSITENALKLIENIDIVKFKVIPFEKS
jgi:plasmid stabilization system protein ParE